MDRGTDPERAVGLGEPASVISLRTRLIVTIVSLVGIALAMAGATAYAMDRAQVNQRVAESLDRAAAEFRVLAVDGVDPRTGTGFATARDLLRVAMQRAVLTPDEGAFGIVNGAVVWLATQNGQIRPEHDQEFVATVLPLASAPAITRGRLDTGLHDHAYLVVPVRTGGGAPAGALVRTVDVNQELGALNHTYAIYALVAVGSLTLVGLISLLIAGRMLAPLSWVRRTAETISDTDLSGRIPVRGHDDLAALTVTLNRMLGRLDRAFGAQRELLDDVGHELRTPLTVIQGHLEVADPTDPDDVAETSALVLGEVHRMRRLVDDLITLAKAERVDFLQRATVDVGRLTDEAFEKARGLGARRWVLADVADVTAEIDSQRITQAWLELAANAVRYSEHDSQITLGSAIAGRELRLWVEDEGIGIASDEEARLRTRFGRSSRPEATGHEGAGLGLAIVESIAAAHHGRLEIDSVPGTGSTMTIVVPLGEPPRSHPSPLGSETPS